MIAIKRRDRWAWSTIHLCDEATHSASLRTTLCGLIEMLVFYFLADSLDACDTRPSWFFRVCCLCCFWRAVHRLLRGCSLPLHRRTPRSRMGPSRCIRPNFRLSMPQSRPFLATILYVTWSVSADMH